MSIGHRLAEDELAQSSIEELYRSLGEGDTPKLFEQSFKLDHEHDIPMGGGSSLDRKTGYIDRALYEEMMDGEFKATGLEPEQLIERWLDHEHTEITIVYGDNPVDVYEPAHQRALRKEHIGVLAILGPKNAAEKIDRYEQTIWPGLMRAYQRPIRKPPLDLWCSPHLDEPTPRDEEILEEMRRFGVIDARKRSKYEVHYGVGVNHCKRCAMFKPDDMAQENRTLALCDSVSGLVRDTRWCELWTLKQSAQRTPL